jgi:hypothetical protein
MTSRKMLGGSSPRRITGTGFHVGRFIAIEADGAGKITIGTLDVNGVNDASWGGLVLASGQSLLSGTKRFTRVQLTSGSGFVYEVP